MSEFARAADHGRQGGARCGAHGPSPPPGGPVQVTRSEKDRVTELAPDVATIENLQGVARTRIAQRSV